MMNGGMDGTNDGMDGTNDEIDDDAFDDGRWGSETRDRLDIVAEPIMYPRSPLMWLLVIAIVPSLGLLLLLRWSDSEADEYEASRDAVDLLQSPLDRGVDLDGTTPDEAEADAESDEVNPALETQLLDYRRTPDLVASVASASQLRTAVDPVLSFIGPLSCAAVSVDRVNVTSLNPDLAVIPASNQKLLVATAALDILGPDHRFTTSVAVPAAVDGVIEGDIYLIGGGDPLLTSDDYPIEDDRRPVVDPTSFDVLADALAEAGITRVRGTIIGDGSRYDDEFVIEEWAPGFAFDEAGPYDALMANDARVRFRSGRQEDPNAGAAREFARLLGNRGIQVDGGWGSGAASNLVDVLASVESAPLSDVIAEMLTTSDNNTAELLLKEIGVATSGEGTRAAGLNAMAASLERLGVPMDNVVLRDGSGLSTQNRVTCAAMLRVVQLAAGGPIDAGLPTASVNGTLAFEFVDTPMAGRLRAKTGTLNNEPFEADPPAVRSLAGFVDPIEDTGAGTIEFVVILNISNASQPEIYQPLWGALGDSFATHPTGPPQDSLGPR